MALGDRKKTSVEPTSIAALGALKVGEAVVVVVDDGAALSTIVAPLEVESNVEGPPMPAAEVVAVDTSAAREITGLATGSAPTRHV